MRNGVLAGLVLGALLGAAPAASADAAPLPPTEIAQDVTLPQAAQARILALNSKGGFGGDRMRWTSPARASRARRSPSACAWSSTAPTRAARPGRRARRPTSRRPSRAHELVVQDAAGARRTLPFRLK